MSESAFICMKTFDLTFHNAVKKYRSIILSAIPQTMADDSWCMSTQLFLPGGLTLHYLSGSPIELSFRCPQC